MSVNELEQTLILRPECPICGKRLSILYAHKKGTKLEADYYDAVMLEHKRNRWHIYRMKQLKVEEYKTGLSYNRPLQDKNIPKDINSGEKLAEWEKPENALAGRPLLSGDDTFPLPQKE
jgi:hypothetical protein